VTSSPKIPGVIGSRAYMGNSDGPSPKPRAGTTEFIRQSIHACHALWGNGSWALRDQRSRPGVLSVHATGRACDLSWRDIPGERGVAGGRPLVLAYLNTITANANTLGIEYVADYWPTKFGRAWRCDRQAWKRYTSRVISGAPGGDWVHIELNTAMSVSPMAVKAAFLKVFGDCQK